MKNSSSGNVKVFLILVFTLSLALLTFLLFKDKVENNSTVPLDNPVTSEVNQKQDTGAETCPVLEGYNGQPVNTKTTTKDYCKAIVDFGENNDYNYSFDFPISWTIRYAGAGGNNLMFNEGTDTELFFISFPTKLSLSNIYKEEVGFEMSVMGILDDKEVIITNKTIILGSKSVQEVYSKLGEKEITRYFFIGNSSSSINGYKMAYVIQVNKEATLKLQNDIINILDTFKAGTVNNLN